VEYTRFFGGGGVTVMISVAVSEPPEFVAMTVYEVAGIAAEGVPERTPVVAENVRAEGGKGWIEYEATALPSDEGVFAGIGAPTTYVAGFTE
jgi:hypothetical protein